MMPRDTEHQEQASGLNESRAHPRVKVHSLAYVELGEGNAGLILNISETGMAVQAVQMLNSNYLPHMQFRLPRTDTLIEVPGKMIWQIRSKKEAGIEFVRLSDPARQAIRQWIAEERSRQGDTEDGRPSGAAARRSEPPEEREGETAGEDQFAQAPGRKDTPAAFRSPAASRPTAPMPGAKSSDANQEESHPAGRHPAPHPTPREHVPSVQPIRRGLPTHWRSGPGSPVATGAEDGSEFAEQPYPERIPAMPRWNGYMAPGVGMEFKKRHGWWTYTAAIGILAAIGFAALMMFNPDAITRARVDTLVHTPSASPNGQPNDQNDTNQTNSPQPNTNGASSSNAQPASPAQPLPLPQAPSSSNGGQSAAPNTPAVSASNNPNEATGQTQAQPHSSQAQSNLPESDASSSSRRQSNNTPTSQQQNSRAANERSRYQSSAQAPPRQNGNREYAYRGNETNNPSDSRYSSGPANAGRTAAPSNSQPARSPSSSYGNPPANNRTQPYTPSGSNSRAQQPAQSSANGQSPIQTYRAQTTAPPTSNPTTSRTNQPTAQQNQAASTHSNPYTTAPQSAANVPGAAAPGPQVAVVDMSGYQTVAVPTSMPLSGVPSGSVAATSQFHAIRVPPSLEWARQFLPGNLGVGRLLSSYAPAYPPEAAREGIQGSVKLDVMVGTDGTVRSVNVLSGPPMLSHAAVSAVRDWRYAETFFAGQSIETEQYVVMVFRLASGN